MTVNSLNQFVKKKKLYLTSSPVSLEGLLRVVSTHAKEPVSSISVDFMGCFFGLLMRIFTASKTRDPVKLFCHIISTMFPPNKIIDLCGKQCQLKDVLTFVFDGDRSAEKMDTTLTRLQTRATVLKKDLAFLKQVNPKQKITKVNWDKMRKVEKHTWSPTHINEIMAELSKKGYNVKKAEGEADVEIARYPSHSILAISNDKVEANLLTTKKG